VQSAEIKPQYPQEKQKKGIFSAAFYFISTPFQGPLKENSDVKFLILEVQKMNEPSLLDSILKDAIKHT
jgi:hypothetical protein